MDDTLVCDRSNKSYWEVLPCGTVSYVVQGGSNFNVCGWNSDRSIKAIGRTVYYETKTVLPKNLVQKAI